ncbi:MAG: LamG domain-containing protein [Planctomycetota bacterium]|jgi:hypothetical protein
MCRKLIHLIPIVLVLAMAASATGGLVGHWRFDEGFGTTTVDSSGNNYDSTFIGDVQWSNDGVYGTCLQFSGGVGIRSYVEAAGSQEIEFGDTDISISVWIKTTATKEMTILTNVRNSGHHSIDMEQTPTLGVNRDDVHIGKVSYDNVFVTSMDSLATVNDGEWHHVALVQHHSSEGTEGWTFYIDGNFDSKKSLDNSPDAGGQRIRIGGGVSHPSFSNSFIGLIDDIRIYNHVLSEAEVMSLVIGESDFAFRQSPADCATDVPRDVVISWMPGSYADKHDVYFGTNFEDVNNADRDNPLGVLVNQNQDANSYSPAELLQFGQTYYWRVDEVNAPPDFTIYKGSVWSFTAELFAYPMPSENITATASSSNSAVEGPENTLNGSGLDANDLHSVETVDMWITALGDLGPAWIQYEFDRVYKLYEMLVWNHNSSVESLVGFGIKDAKIEYSTNGTDYATLGTTHEFAQAPGADGYACNTTVDFDGVAAKYIRLTANSNWGMLPQYGLSEVRFLYIPVVAREPKPASGATNIEVDNVTLSWRAGREAAKHDVYLSTDEQAVIDGTAPITTVTDASHGPLSLDLAQTYFWKVDEVNEAESPAMWEGDLWNFTTREFLVVDDFESYNDLDPDAPQSNRIFNTWIDGYEQPMNGSIVGYDVPPFAEQSTVHSGWQSMPLAYDNTGTAVHSEAERTFAVGQNWTKAGAVTLVLYFHGTEGNTGQLYVKVNDSKVVYDGDAGDIAKPQWQQWNIDLASVGMNLQNVTKLAIGINGTGASGKLYFDDIRLYRLAP